MNLRTALIGMLLASLGGCASQPEVREAEYDMAEPIVVAEPMPVNGAIYQAGYDRRLFEDVKARQVGDLLTVQLVEQTDASKSASTSTSKEQDIDMGGPTLFGGPVVSGGNEILSIGVGADRDFEGSGASKQSNELSGSLTVVVSRVLPNGNLMIRGEKLLTLNQGDEYLRLSGIVRPEDVQSDNTVLSTRIANARIIYGGKGVVADANSMGWLSRFFQSVFWPF